MHTKFPALLTVPYMASDDRSLIDNFLLLEPFDGIDAKATADSVTCEQIKEYLLSLMQRNSQSHDPALLWKARTGWNSRKMY